MGKNAVKVAITADAQEFQQGMQQASNAANNFGKSMNSAGQKSQTFMGQMRTARRTALELAQAYDQLDAAAKNSDFGRSMKAQLDEAVQAAGRLVDLKGDVMREINAVASDTFAWDAAKEGIGIVSSGLQGLASIYGLCGGETKAFAQALVAVNAVQGVANTMITIGNALQKESALMTALRAAKNALFTTTETAATVATVANTAAETANTTATGANTTSKMANVAATGAQTAATTAATTSQLALNVAVLANPYVLAAAAIAALCAGIYFWVDSMNKATDSEAALTAATEAFNEEVDSTMKTVGEQISLYDDLKRQYDACGGKTDEFSKKLINNTDVQKRLGVVVKTVDDVHKLFARNSDAYRKATLARASALAAETAQATMLGKTLAELSKIQAKLAAGEEVNWTDLKDVVKSAGYNDKTAQQIMIKAGFEIEGEFFGKDDVKKATGDFTKLITEMTKGGAYKALQDMADGFKANFNEINDIDFNGLLSSSFDALEKIDYKTDKSSKKSRKNAKNTKQEIEKVLTSLEGCDAIIQQAEKDMKALKSTSADYSQKLEKLKNTILMARIAKLQLLDKTTIDGLSQSKQLIEQIIKSLPQGHEKIEPLKKDLAEINEKIYDFYATTAKNGDLKSLSDARSQVENIIKELPAGSAELVRWARIWHEINDKIEIATEELEDLKRGIEKGSITQINQEITKLQTRLKNKKLGLSARLDIEMEIDDLKRQLANINAYDFEWEQPKPFEITFDYKKTPLEKAQRDYEKLEERAKYLRDVIKNPETPDWGIDNARKELEKLQPVLNKLRKNATMLEMAEDVKEYTKALHEAHYEAFKGFADGMSTIYDTLSGLGERLDECKNGFEGFFEVLDAGFRIVDSILSFIDTIKQVSEITKTLTAAKAANSAVTESETSNLVSNTAAMVANATASTAAATAKATEATAGFTNAGANAAEAVTETASQNAKMGPWGWVAAIAAAAAMGALLFSMIGRAKGYANGGIITGSHTMGDQLIAKVNAGEMILNTRQQAHLFDMLNNGMTETTNNAPTTTTFKVRGSDLYATLTNYQKITGKTL